MTAAGSPAPATAGPASLVEDAVHVWTVALQAGPPGVAAIADERQRAERMADGDRRARFLASRAWLRVVLGRYAGLDAAAVRFVVAGRGKPSVVNGGDLCFSLSRSADVAFIAVTRGRSVGVDVERVRGDLDHDVLAERFFSPAEADGLRRLPEPDRRDVFFGLWVRKEAVLKASGAGLGDGLSHIDVRGDRVAGRWSVASLDAGPGAAAAVAVEGRMGPCATRSISVLPAPGPSELDLGGAPGQIPVF